MLTEVRQPGFEVSNSLGYLLQAGVDFGDSDWGLFGFFDVRYIGGATIQAKISDMTVRISNPDLAATLDAIGYGEDIDVGDGDIELDINPVIYTLGLGYRF